MRPLLFSSVVPACGSYLLCSQDLNGSESSEAGDQKRTTRLAPQSGRHGWLSRKSSSTATVGARHGVPLREGAAGIFIRSGRPKVHGDQWTSRLLKFLAADRGNKARMSMKTKGKDKKSSDQWVEELRSQGQELTVSIAHRPRAGRRRVTFRLLDCSTHQLWISTEQSQNVYENKGQGQKIERPMG